MTPQIKKLTTAEVREDKRESVGGGGLSSESSKEKCVCVCAFVSGCLYLLRIQMTMALPLKNNDF